MKTPVLIATPLRSWRSPQESLSPHLRQLLVELGKLDGIWSFDFATYAGGNVARGRNKIVAYALRCYYRYIIFIDDDIEPTTLDVIRLLSHKQHVVGALYTTREEKARLVLNPFKEAKVEANGLIAVGETGCGFKCYHRSVFEYLIKNEPSLAYVSDEDANPEWGFFSMGCVVVDGKSRWLSEDYWLDQLCRRHGITVYADTETRVIHRDQHSGIAYPVGEWPAIPAPRVPPTPPPMAEDFPYTEKEGRFVMVLQYHEGDELKARNLARFIEQISPDAMLVPFKSRGGLGYPEGPNQTAFQAMSLGGDYGAKAILLLEADCVPLAPDWIEQLSAEWDRARAAGKLVLGSWRPECGPLGHINGCMIFDPSLAKVVDLGTCPKDVAWDIHYAKAFSPYWARTGLIANRYKEICVTEEQLLTPECGSRSPVLVHGVKDDSAWNIAQKLLKREAPSLHLVV